MRMRHLGLEISEQRGCRDQVIGSLQDEGFRQIDADDCGQIGWCRDLSLEALGMRGIGRLQNFGALLPERGSGAEMHRRWRHETDARMAMLVVVQVDDRTPMLPSRG